MFSFLLISLYSEENSFSQRGIDTLEEVWNSVKKYHYDDSINEKLDVIYKRYKPLAAQAKSDSEIADIANKMLQELKQSHLYLLPPENKTVIEALQVSENVKKTVSNKPKKDFKEKAVEKIKETDIISNMLSPISDSKDVNQPADIGVRLCLADNKVCVLDVKSNSPADKAGISIGYVISEVNGVKINPQIKSFYPWDVITERMFQGKLGTEIYLSVITREGEEKKLTLKLAPTGKKWISMGYMPKIIGEFQYKILPGNIGYIFFSPCFTQQIMEFQYAIMKMEKIDGLIIDVRNNPGGILFTPSAITGWLSDKEVDFGIMDMKGTELNIKSYPQADAFTGPLVVLTNRGTGSAAEIFAAGMQDAKRAKIIGERTAGKCLPSIFIKLKTGFRLQTITGNCIRANGEEIEIKGVTPNIKVKMKYKDLIQGKDSILEEARNVLKEN